MEGDEQDREQARSFPTRPEPRYSRSLERGLAILACFTPENPVLGIAEVADGLGMSRSTTHRYMSTLVAQGYLQREQRKYRLALGAVDLGLRTLDAMGFCNHARPDLQELATQSGHAVEMAVLDGLEILLLDSVGHKHPSRSDPSPDVRAGSRLPAYCTSMGKVLLAYLPAMHRSRLLSRMQLVKRGPHTITGAKELNSELGGIRANGLAVNNEERIAGTCAIAAPIRDETGDVVAAVAVSAHNWEVDIEDLKDRCAGSLARTAERISERLGWQATEN